MIDIKQFISAIDQIAEEKGIDRSHVTEIIGQALAAAYKKDYGERGETVKAELDTKTGSAKFYQSFMVVDEDMILTEDELVELQKAAELFSQEGEQEATPKVVSGEDDEEDVELVTEGEEGEERKIRFNPKRHMMLSDAKEIQKDAVVGDEILIPLPEKDEFGRIAAQTAKQVIIQRIREAERNAVYEAFKEKEGDIVSGSIQRIERGVVHLDVGRTTGVLFPEEQIPHERYRQGQRIRVYVARVSKDPRGPVIVLSRRHPSFVAKLFELEVPEMAAGVVTIKAIAREAGSRSKVAVYSSDDSIDPVGACVGQKGIRVSAVINELGGENIDIISWDEDSAVFIGHALSPAKVASVSVDKGAQRASVEVPEDQLSLAIGRKGQNVRLAAKLTGWRIDVRGSEKVLEEEGIDAEEHEAEMEAAVSEGLDENDSEQTSTE